MIVRASRCMRAMPGIANRQWYSVERYTSQALPSAAKRAIGLLSTRCDGYDAAFAGLAAAVVAHARGCRHVRASRCMRAMPGIANRQWYSVEALYVASAAKEARPSELQGCFAYCTLRLAIAPPPKQYHYIKSCTATHATLPSISIYMHSSYMRLKNPEKIDPWW